MNRLPMIIAMVCLLCVYAALTQAQSGTGGLPAARWTPDSIPMGSSIGFAAAFPVVKGHPYTAHIVTQHVQPLPDGRNELHEAHNIHRRDSEGRMVDEQLPSPKVKSQAGEGYTQHRFVVVDPSIMASIQWADEDKTVVVSALPGYLLSLKLPNGKCLAASGYESVNQEELGERTIAGVTAEGCRTTATIGGKTPLTLVIESWRSPVLGIDLLVESRYSSGEKRRMEVTELDLAEPNDAWFKPPEDYTRVGDVVAR